MLRKKCAAILSHWKFFPFCVWIFYLPSMQLTEGTRPLQTAPGNILPIAEAMQSIPHKLTSDLTNRGRIKAGKKPVLSSRLSFSPFLKKSGGGRKSKSLSSLRSLAKWYQGIIVHAVLCSIVPEENQLEFPSWFSSGSIVPILSFWSKMPEQLGACRQDTILLLWSTTSPSLPHH